MAIRKIRNRQFGDIEKLGILLGKFMFLNEIPDF